MSNSESNKRPLGWTKTAQKRKRKPEYESVSASGVESINDSKSSQEARSQQEGEERFRNFLDNLGDVAYEADTSGNVTYANKMAEKMTGFPLKDIIGKPFLPLFTKESQQIAVDVYERTLNGEGTECELTFTNGRICHFKNEPLRDENGRITGVFGIARDITERKRVERALQESEERFKNLFNNALLGLYRTTPDGRILMANPALIRMLGYDSFEELAERNLEEEGFEPQYFRSNFKERIEAIGRVIGLEADWTRRDGTILSIRESARAIPDEHGNILYYEGTVEDITERKRAEQELKRHRDHLEEIVTTRTRELERNNEALRIAELRFRSLIEQTTDAVFCYEYDPPIPTDLPLEQQLRLLNDGVLVECNDICAKSYGENQAEDVTGKRLTELFRTTPQNFNQFFTALIEGKYRIVDAQGAEKLEDGTEVYYLNNGHGVIEDDKLIRVWGTFRDITDRKKAQETLRQYEFMVESAHDAIFFKDRQSRYIIANKKTLESFGLPREKVIGKSDYEIMPDGEQARNNINDDRTVFETGKPKEIIKEMTGADGKIYWFQAVKVPHFDENGHVIGLIGIARDITERKQAEEELRIREQKLRALLNAPTESAILVDVDGTILDINRIAAKRLGKSSEELIGIGIYDYLPAEIAEYRKARGEDVISSGKPLRFQDEREGRYYDNNIYPVFDDKGKVNAVAVFSQDITERRQAEKALMESESRFRELVENMREVFWMENAEGTELLYVSPAYEEIWGRSCEEFYENPKVWIDTIHPDDRKRVEDAFTKGRLDGTYSEEFRIIRPDGSIRWIWDRGVQIRNESDEVIRVAGIAEDVTERKRTEEALRESEEKFRSLAEQSPNMIFINKKGTVVYANKKCEQVMGYAREELCSGDFDFHTLIAPESMDAINDSFIRHLRGEEVKPYDYCLINKKGERIEAINASKLIQYEGQTAILGVITDITERKQTEKELLEHQAKLKSLASQLSLTEERERHRLATDLHDQISQSLVISKIKLDQLRKSLTSDEFSMPLEDISNCLGRIIDDTRTLTFDLSYPILYELGFEAAVAEWLADQIQEKHGIRTEFVDDGRQKPLDDDIRVLLFRNVRELLINIVKHAQANKVRVSIRKVKDNICISVEDDGVGFDPVEVTSLATKRAEFGLFSIRERLEQLGGMIEIDSDPGCGSKITMRAPLKHNNSIDRLSK